LIEMADARRVSDFSLAWGESVRWDDRRQRLYFVDCAAHVLLWLDHAQPPLQTLQLPSMPTGVVLADDGRLVVALDGGLHVVDVDTGRVELLAPYPDGLGQRANDAAADLDGNLVTGTLNLAPGPGSYWWYSSADGWRQLADGIGNANGPAVIDCDGQSTLVFADTLASVLYAYDYDGPRGRAGERRVFADTSQLRGQPDGASPTPTVASGAACSVPARSCATRRRVPPRSSTAPSSCPAMSPSADLTSTGCSSSRSRWPSATYRSCLPTLARSW
jgi:sugar lactone lactonase YvrE